MDPWTLDPWLDGSMDPWICGSDGGSKTRSGTVVQEMGARGAKIDLSIHGATSMDRRINIDPGVNMDYEWRWRHKNIIREVKPKKTGPKVSVCLAIVFVLLLLPKHLTSFAFHSFSKNKNC